MTGAYGFIGSNFVHFLMGNAPGARVVAVDNLGFAANPANLDGVRDRVSVVEADIADLEAMQAAYRESSPDYVVNFAAESHNDRAIVDPSAFMRSNALGAQVLLECSRRHPCGRTFTCPPSRSMASFLRGSATLTSRAR